MTTQTDRRAPALARRESSRTASARWRAVVVVTRGRVHNLTFHGIGSPPRVLDAGEARVWLDTKRFLAVLDAVNARDDVRITFDDSNRSDVDIALPALLERRMTAMFFVLAGRLEDADHLGRQDVRRLADTGMTIGSHGLHHRNWRRLSTREMTEEVVESRRILESAAGASITAASVPFGQYDRRVLAVSRGAGGYARVFTSDGCAARAEAWLQPRSTVLADAHPAALLRSSTRLERIVPGVKRCVKRWR